MLLNVIRCCANRCGINDFLLALNSNLTSTFNRSWDITRRLYGIWSNQVQSTTQSHYIYRHTTYHYYRLIFRLVCTSIPHLSFRWNVSLSMQAGRRASVYCGLVIMLSFALLVMLASAKFWSLYTVKHALQNTQNYCYQWLSHSFRVHQIRFRSRTPLGSLQCSPDLLAGLRGTLFLRGRSWEGKEGKWDEERGGEEKEDVLLTLIPDQPLVLAVLLGKNTIVRLKIVSCVQRSAISWCLLFRTRCSRTAVSSTRQVSAV